MAEDRIRVVAEVSGVIAFTVPAQAAPPPAPVIAAEGPRVMSSVDLGTERRASHGPGFASVDWYGTVYHFTPKQRAIVAALWQAWETGELYVTESDLLQVADSDGVRVRDLFKRCPAWGTMICQGVLTGGPAGSFQLVSPPMA